MDDVGSFHRFARAYDLLMPPAKAAPLRAALERATRPVERILDVGGGTGRGARALDAGRTDRITIVDAAPGMLRVARRHSHPTIAGDATRLPVRNASVDAVLVIDALHHMPDHPAVLGECRRILRPGGVAVVREFDPSTLRGRLLVSAERAVGFDSRFHTPDALAGLLRTAGFEPALLGEGFGYTVAGVAETGRHKTSPPEQHP